VLAAVVTAGELSERDTVVEVGPGSGILTRELAARVGRLVAVELDRELAGHLEKEFAAAVNVTVINDDIMQLDPAALPGVAGGYKVVANLPYYITSAVLRRFLEASTKPELMVVMVQREVAEAITASPGRMSVLSVAVQFYGQPEIIDYAPAACFYPPPEVDSAILRIRVLPCPAVAVSDEASFFGLVRAGFNAARKQLVNSLGQGLGLEKAAVQALLEGSGIEPRRRAETLSLVEWGRLWQAWRGPEGAQ